MADRIIYPKDDGTIAVIIPAPNTRRTTTEIAAKDVPTGKPYRIVQDTDIPSDRTYRDAWTEDFTDPDGVGA